MEGMSEKRFTIIHDNNTESLAIKLLHSQPMMAVIHTVDSYYINTQTHDDVSDANTILLCGIHCVQQVFDRVTHYSMSNPGQSAIPFRSQWLIISDESNRSMIESLAIDIDNVALITVPEMTHGRLHIIERNDTKSLKLYTLMWTSNGRRFRRITEVQSRRSLKTLTKLDIFPNRKFGFNGRTFSVTTEMWKPFVNIEVVNNTNVYSGILMEFLEELSYTMNFSYELYRPSDKEFGVLVNGSWTGMVGQLQRREVDMAMAALTVESARNDVMDFTIPFYHLYNRLAMKKPSFWLDKWLTVANVFQWPVIVVILASVALAMTTLYITERCGASTQPNHQRDWGHMMLNVYGIFITRSVVFESLTKSGRILLVSWSFIAIVFSATYTGNLMTFFMVSKHDSSISSLEDLVNQNEYAWGTMGGTSLRSVLQASNSTILKQVWEGIEKFRISDPDILHPSEDVHIEKVKNSKYVYIIDQLFTDKISLMDCDISIGKDQFLPENVAFGVQKDSPLRKPLSDKVMEMMENGMVDRWMKYGLKKKNSCAKYAKEIIATEGLQLVYLEVAFVILLVGLVLGTICFVAELMR